MAGESSEVFVHNATLCTDRLVSDSGMSFDATNASTATATTLSHSSEVIRSSDQGSTFILVKTYKKSDRLLGCAPRGTHVMLELPQNQWHTSKLRQLFLEGKINRIGFADLGNTGSEPRIRNGIIVGVVRSP
jgi:hypothetical protein